MAYTKQTWIDYPNETTPMSAERLNHMEDGIENAGESAGNLEIGFNDTPYQIQNDIAMMNINLHTYDEEDEEVIQSYETCPGPDTFYQLKAFLECKINAAKDPYNVALTKDGTNSYIEAYYKDGENVEYQYQLEEGNMALIAYNINDSHSLPKDIDASTEPAELYTPLRSNYTSYIGQDDTICYAKYYGNVIPTYIFQLYGESNMYYAVAFYTSGSTVYTFIIPVNTSTHKIVTNNYIGKRYAAYQYAYYPFNLRYNVSSSGGGSTKTLNFNSVTNEPIYYKDNGIYTPYSLSSGTPFVYGYIGIDFSKYDLESVDITLHDGTILSDAYVGQDEDIASSGTSGFDATYYIHQYTYNPDGETGKFLVLALYPTSSETCYVYGTIIDTLAHEYSASPELYGGSGSSPYLSMTLYFKELKTIDDNNASKRTTYSSKKIEALIANLQSQIDALNN